MPDKTLRPYAPTELILCADVGPLESDSAIAAVPFWSSSKGIHAMVDHDALATPCRESMRYPMVPMVTGRSPRLLPERRRTGQEPDCQQANPDACAGIESHPMTGACQIQGHDARHERTKCHQTFAATTPSPSNSVVAPPPLVRVSGRFARRSLARLQAI